MKAVRIVAAAFCATMSTSAIAAVTINATYDLSNLSGYQNGNLLIFDRVEALSPVLTENETLFLTIDFVGNQTLIINDPARLGAGLDRLISPIGITYNAYGSILFYDPSDNLKPSIVIPFAYPGIPDFGYTEHFGLLTTDTGPVEFSGFKLGLRIQDFAFNEPHVFERSLFVFESASGSFSVGQIAAIPEPATWAMMIVGFGAVGYSLRRRRPCRFQQPMAISEQYWRRYPHS